MNSKQKIQSDLTTALKEKDYTKISVLKMLLASVINKEIELSKKDEGLPKEEIQKVIRSETKKRHDSIEAYTKADRPDLADKEKRELAVLKPYLPEELPDEKIEKIVKETIEETSADSMQDFGKVMKEAMIKIKGRADGKKVSEAVKKFLKL